MGHHIENVRKCAPQRTQKPRPPDHAIDECEKAYEVTDEKKEKTSGRKFDNTGLMALVCYHDIPLFFANVDTPGEQQKYMFALIKHMFSLLSPSVMVIVFADVCVLQ